MAEAHQAPNTPGLSSPVLIRTKLHVPAPRPALVSRLQALVQTGRVKLPSTREAEALARELQDYEIRIDENANDRYGAFKVGTHDDLVTALGLAVLEDPRAQRVELLPSLW